MKWNWKIGTFFGTKVYVNLTWFLVFIVFVDWFPFEPMRVLTDMIVVILLFASVLIHEYGHTLTARKYGIPTDKIYLHVMGGMAMIDIRRATPKQHFWIALAGPLTSAGIAFVAFAAGIFLVHIFSLPIESTALDISAILCILNIMLAVFNLLPIFPMDGGRILRSWMEIQGKDPKKAMRTSAKVSQVFCGVLFLLGIYTINFIMIVIAVIFFLYARAEIKKG